MGGRSPLLAEDRFARAAWSRIAEPGDPDAFRLIGDLGAPGALACVSEAGDPSWERFAPRLEILDIERDIEVGAKVGARLLCPGDDEWPAGVEDLASGGSTPYCLWVRGPLNVASAAERSVAVVGARSCTAYGQAAAAEMAADLTHRKFAIVSGAAFGIDAAAHRGALAVEGATIAVMAGGVDRPYPAAHAQLVGEIARVGAVVSEVAPGCAPTKRRFLQRNRLIATISRGTFVVEAGLRSGSLNTARWAADYSRVVVALPGPVTSMMSAGCHELIRNGRAELVTDAAEVAEAIGSYGVDLAPSRRTPALPTDDLDDDSLRVLSALPVSRGVPVSRLAVTAGSSVKLVSSVLGRLELRGLAERHGDGWRTGRGCTR